MHTNREAIERFLDGKTASSHSYRSEGDRLYYGGYGYYPQKGFRRAVLVGFTDKFGNKLVFKPSPVLNLFWRLERIRAVPRPIGLTDDLEGTYTKP